MTREDADIRDEALARSLRAALRTEHAPEAWVREALGVPSRLAEAGVRRRASMMLLPHICGLTLLLGLVIALLIRPEAVNILTPESEVSIGRFLKDALPSIPLSLEGFSRGFLLAALSTPFLLYFLNQGLRGFPVLHRRSPR